MSIEEELSQSVVLPIDQHLKRIEFYKKQNEEYKKKNEELRRALEMDKQIINYYLNNNAGTGANSSLIKRKSLSFRESKRKTWCKEDARAAFDTECAFLHGIKITIRFPDCEIDDASIMQSNDKIDSISFISSRTPRFCTAIINPNANLNEIVKQINETPFGNGYLRAELPLIQNYAIDELADLFRINPRVLYVGNIPINPKVTSQVIKNFFRNVKKIDISTHKKSPYKFLHAQYRTVKDAIDDFHRLVHKIVENQSLDVHFFRIKDNIETSNNNNNNNNHNKTVIEHDPETGVSSSSCFYNEDGVICNNTYMEEEESMHSSSSMVTTSTFRLPPCQFNAKIISFDQKSNSTNTLVDGNSEDLNLDTSETSFSNDNSDLNSLESAVKEELKPIQINEIPVAEDDDDEDVDADANTDDYDRENNLMFIPYNEDDDESDFSS